MRTTSIPAQITTVEDKIAGNLNLTQILLLLAPVFLSTVIYSVLPEPVHFSTYKIPLIGITFIVFAVLALRIKERVVLNWIIILASYWIRPHRYLFNKNDLFLREVVSDAKSNTATKKVRKIANTNSTALTISESVQTLANQIEVRNPRLNFRFNRKGVLVVQTYE